LQGKRGFYQADGLRIATLLASKRAEKLHCRSICGFAREYFCVEICGPVELALTVKAKGMLD
jgi:hypothetical protein